MKILYFKKITFLVTLIIISCNLFLNAQNINVNFNNGFPANDITNYTAQNCTPGVSSYWVDNNMNSGCPGGFPNQNGTGNFMTIDVTGGAPPAIVWARNGLNLSGCYNFMIDVIHRFGPNSNPTPAPQEVNLQLTDQNGFVITNIPIGLGRNWRTFAAFGINIPDGTTTLSIQNVSGAGSNNDFAIDNIILTSCCDACNLSEPEFTILATNDDCSIQFCSISADYDFPCTNEEWTIDYGDGTPIVNTNGPPDVCYTHTYTCNGSYDVCITVTVIDAGDEFSCISTTCETIEITDCIDCCGCDNPKIIGGPVFNDRCTVAVCAHSECTGATYEWDFGNGNIYQGSSVEHTYSCNGTYEYCWTMFYEDPPGYACVNSDCETVTISECRICTDPGTTNPGPTNPGPTNPGPTNPGPTNPGPTNPGPINPGPTNPGPINPNDGNPRPGGYYGGMPKLSSGTNQIDNDIKLFPNPIINRLSLNLISASQNTINIQVFDQAGKVVVNHSKPLDKGFNKYDFDFANLSNGIYFIRLSNSEISYTQKLIKN